MIIGPDRDGLFLGGPLDVICILHDVGSGLYHAALFEEAPVPGGAIDRASATSLVRLRSLMHHVLRAALVERPPA